MNTFIVLLIVLLLALLFSVLGIRICIFYNLFHIPCVGCGMTRALKLILRFKIIESFRYNILMFPICLSLVIYFIFFIFKKNYIIDNFINKNKKIIIIIVCMITAVAWFININNSLLY